MAFSKKTYISGQTAITADNLNAIQDELIRVGGSGTLPVADYVIEQGTSGVWFYRKWNSGFAECWTHSAITARGVHWADVLGGYGYAISLSFPQNLFTNVTTVIANGCTGTGSGFAWPSSSNKNDVTVIVVGNQEDNQLKIQVEAKGYWK